MEYSTFFSVFVESGVIFDDKYFGLESFITKKPRKDHLEFYSEGSSIYFPLSKPVSVKTIDKIFLHSTRKNHEQVVSAYIRDSLNDEGKGFLDTRYRGELLKFIVEELLPSLLIPSVEDRLKAMENGNLNIPSGKDILKEVLGDKLESRLEEIDVSQFALSRFKNKLDPSYDKTRSIFTNSLSREMFSNVVIIKNKFFALSDVEQDSGVHVVIGGKRFHRSEIPLSINRNLDGGYFRFLVHDAYDKAADLIYGAKTKLIVGEYMQLLAMDEFTYKDIGFFRNGDTYFLFTKIPKFARQTTYNENLFIPKQFDENGIAGEIGIGICLQEGKFAYKRYESSSEGVVYRGPIDKDAPFNNLVSIIDPAMRAKYGNYLRTICHVGGYPKFELSPQGFSDFMNYAVNNFLNSFRKDFTDRHFDLPEQRELFEKGAIITKDEAIRQGYMLCNIHKVKKSIDIAEDQQEGG